MMTILALCNDAAARSLYKPISPKYRFHKLVKPCTYSGHGDRTNRGFKFQFAHSNVYLGYTLIFLHTSGRSKTKRIETDFKKTAK